MKNKYGFYHMGHGLVVCDKTKEKDGDYLKVAFAYSNRNIKFYEELSPEDIIFIATEIKNNDSNISATQEVKIFETRPTQHDAEKCKHLATACKSCIDSFFKMERK